MLFPRYDKRCNKYLKRLQKKRKVDSVFGSQILIPTPYTPILPPYKLSEFRFYRERLTILVDELEAGKPTSLKQVFYDRRNRQTWYTIWIAVAVFIMTVLFGIISSITSIMQTWKAYHPSA